MADTEPEPTTPRLTESDVDAIEARVRAATLGPIEARLGSGNNVCTALASVAPATFDEFVCDVLPDYACKPGLAPRWEANRNFIEHAYVDIPALIRDWRAMRKCLDDALVRAAEDQDYDSEQRAALATENAALREQLAQAELAQERLQTAVQLALQGLNERCSEVAALQWFQSEYCFAVEKVRDADESTVFELRKGLPTLTGKQLPTGVGP